MWFPSSKRVVRVLLPALFLACLGLFFSTGQVFAAHFSEGESSYHTWCDQHGNNDHACNQDRENSTSSSDQCDRWDPNTGYCIHWQLHIYTYGPSVYDHWDSNRHDWNGDNRHTDCNCDNSK